MKPGNTGLTRLVKAFGYSAKGFAACFRHEAAFRQEIAASIILIPLGLWLGQTGVERALLVGSWLLVLVVELINSAIEAVVDRVDRGAMGTGGVFRLARHALGSRDPVRGLPVSGGDGDAARLIRGIHHGGGSTA